MAYSDYGAFVYKNGVRQPQLEDADIDERFWKVGLKERQELQKQWIEDAYSRG